MLRGILEPFRYLGQLQLLLYFKCSHHEIPRKIFYLLFCGTTNQSPSSYHSTGIGWCGTNPQRRIRVTKTWKELGNCSPSETRLWFFPQHFHFSYHCKCVSQPDEKSARLANNSKIIIIIIVVVIISAQSRCSGARDGAVEGCEK